MFFQAEKEVMHWNKSVFHNFYQQGHASDAHKNEKGRVVGLSLLSLSLNSILILVQWGHTLEFDLWFRVKTHQSRGDSMIFRVSRAAEPCRPRTMWLRQRTVPSCEIKCQKSGDSMFGEIRQKKLVLTSNFKSIQFRQT